MTKLTLITRILYSAGTLALFGCLTVACAFG